jgi:hypothetical protein
MDAPLCPHCAQPIDKVVDVPYGWWEWNGEKYVAKTAATRVDVAPWVHIGCMGELRRFHPQNPVQALPQ